MKHGLAPMPTFALPSRNRKLSISREFFLLSAIASLALGCSRTGTVSVESGRPVRVAPIEELVVGTVESLDVEKNGGKAGIAVGGSDHVYDLPRFDQDGRVEDQLLDHNYETRPVGGVVRMSFTPGW
jgi:hypothetical protein